MNITIENKKQKAIELMQKLDIYKPYIKGFKEKTDVCFFECFGGYWAYQEPELMAKIKEFEEQYNVLVYAVTHISVHSSPRCGITPQQRWCVLQSIS